MCVFRKRVYALKKAISGLLSLIRLRMLLVLIPILCVDLGKFFGMENQQILRIPFLSGLREVE